jgi:hypothetical protein
MDDCHSNRCALQISVGFGTGRGPLTAALAGAVKSAGEIHAIRFRLASRTESLCDPVRRVHCLASLPVVVVNDRLDAVT